MLILLLATKLAVYACFEMKIINSKEILRNRLKDMTTNSVTAPAIKDRKSGSFFMRNVLNKINKVPNNEGTEYIFFKLIKIRWHLS